MFLRYNFVMAVKETNKQMNITISRNDYARLEEIANAECRSVSKQALLFLLKAMNDYEGKRDK